MCVFVPMHMCSAHCSVFYNLWIVLRPAALPWYTHWTTVKYSPYALFRCFSGCASLVVGGNRLQPVPFFGGITSKVYCQRQRFDTYPLKWLHIFSGWNRAAAGGHCQERFGIFNFVFLLITKLLKFYEIPSAFKFCMLFLKKGWSHEMLLCMIHSSHFDDWMKIHIHIFN